MSRSAFVSHVVKIHFEKENMKLSSTLRISLTLSALSLVGLATSLPATAAKLYSVTDLGTLGGTFSEANGINNLGQVVGTSSIDTEQRHAFRTAPNSPINPATDDLGFLEGRGGSIGYSIGYSINNLGQVAGTLAIGQGVPNAFRTAPNSPLNRETDNLGSLGGGGSNFANGIKLIGL